MVWICFWVLWPVGGGLVLAVGWWLLRTRRTDPHDRRPPTSGIVAGFLLLTIAIATRVLFGPLAFVLDLPSGLSSAYSDLRFGLPLVLGVLGLVIVAFPFSARRTGGAADLAPRTPFSFARGGWFVTPAIVLAAILALTIAAGLASERDTSTGRYDAYTVAIGGETSMGTTIYGWFYSVPCLIAIGVLIAAAGVDLVLIARPALARDRDHDIRRRTTRTRTVLTLATGALLLHLGLVLDSLAGTATLRGRFSTSVGPLDSWTPFAALEPALSTTSGLATALGFACWFAVLLSGVPARRSPEMSRP